VILQEKGKDWRKIDLELEHRRIDRYAPNPPHIHISFTLSVCLWMQYWLGFIVLLPLIDFGLILAQAANGVKSKPRPHRTN